MVITILLFLFPILIPSFFQALKKVLVNFAWFILLAEMDIKMNFFFFGYNLIYFRLINRLDMFINKNYGNNLVIFETIYWLEMLK